MFDSSFFRVQGRSRSFVLTPLHPIGQALPFSSQIIPGTGELLSTVFPTFQKLDDNITLAKLYDSTKKEIESRGRELISLGTLPMGSLQGIHSMMPSPHVNDYLYIARAPHNVFMLFTWKTTPEIYRLHSPKVNALFASLVYISPS
eukprot:TRINITY_DN3399_c0_g2_i1.p1 TRINITY_DN3399_c0_g2~~TRINITY_DN3399_c0_g2_i1.p1  ORF type:complete len:146 (+),score=18.35 TRINITY_DN3399_c0_g2_i1:86-523(+)